MCAGSVRHTQPSRVALRGTAHAALRVARFSWKRTLADVPLDFLPNPARLSGVLPHRPVAPRAGVAGSGRRPVGPPAAARRPEHSSLGAARAAHFVRVTRPLSRNLRL